MDLGADIARERGYPYWKSLTTGKSVSLGSHHASRTAVYVDVLCMSWTIEQQEQAKRHHFTLHLEHSRIGLAFAAGRWGAS